MDDENRRVNRVGKVQSDRVDFAQPDQFIRSKSCSLPTNGDGSGGSSGGGGRGGGP